MTIFITRREHEALKRLFLSYLHSFEWIELPKSWSVDGVTVTTSRQDRADALRDRLEVVREHFREEERRAVDEEKKKRLMKPLTTRAPRGDVVRVCM